jgi:hypothetical protein
MQPGYRSQWAKNVGGAAKPELPAVTRYGDRSPLFFWGGGATKPLSTGRYAGPRSMLAFWIGGANWHYMPEPPVPPAPPYIPGDLTGGIPHGKHHGKGERKAQELYLIDDEEILEWLRTWTIWNDIE